MADDGSVPSGALRWTPQWTVHVVPDEAVYLLSEAETVVLEQPLAREVAVAVDGNRTVDEVVDVVAETSDLANAYFLVDEMIDRGYLTADSSPWPEPLEALAREWGAKDPPASTPRFTVTWAGSARADAQAVHQALLDSELNADLLPDHEVLDVRPGSDAPLLIVVADDYLHPSLPKIDQLRRQAGSPWLLARSTRAYAWIGPLFTPGTGPCWRCMAHRIRGNRDVEEYLRLKNNLGSNSVRPQECGPPITQALTAGLVGSWALRWAFTVDAPTRPAAGDGRKSNPHTIQTMELATGTVENHIVVKRPQCPECGQPSSDGSGHPEFTVDPGGNLATNDSGYRAVPPEQTLERFSDHISPISGAVTQLTPLDVAGANGLHVYAAGHNFAMRGSDLRYLRAGLRNKSSGKGITETQAKVSALGEALERYQGLYCGEEPSKTTTLRELDSDGIHPNKVMLWSERQFDDRNLWNSRDNKFAIVPERFGDDVVCDFSPLWSLTEQRSKWLPTGMLYYGAPRPDNHMYFIACSNGSAAGNTKEEAMLQGMLELVERDAVAVWWYNRLRRPPIDPSTLDYPQLDDILATFDKLGRPIELLDLTHDLGIPVVAAISARHNAVTEDILMGFGAHLDPRIAAVRAVSEVVQFYPAVAPHGSDGSGDYDYDDRESQDWWRTATLKSEPYLEADESAPRADVAAGIGPVDDMAQAINLVQSRIEGAGLEVLVLDQTRPDIGFPTVKVVAPGLRHFWARFGPGRLFDVPVQLGWLSQPHAESELNARVMFL